MRVNTTKLRDGAIVSAETCRALVNAGWVVTGISQVIEGRSYWVVENDEAMDRALVIWDWDDDKLQTSAAI
jgi:hypothetical protein